MMKMNEVEALAKLLELREGAYKTIRAFYQKKFEINEDIEHTRQLIDEIEAEIRRLIEI